MSAPQGFDATFRFSDRQAAGRMLGTMLAQRRVRASVVLGLTRGGVPIALEVARTLGVPMDVKVIKKLRAPISAELAIGAVSANGARIVHQEVVRESAASRQYLAEEVKTRLEEARQAEAAYRRGHPAVPLEDARVLLVDDGLATGSTMETAVLSVRRQGPERVMVGVPVGSGHACDNLGLVADEVFCLWTPQDFWAVGQFYKDFTPVSDDEVRWLLDEARVGIKAGQPAP